MGVILSQKVGGGRFANFKPGFYFIVQFSAQCLPNHATSKLGLLNKIIKRVKKWGGQNIVCPLGVKKWGGHVPPPPNYAHVQGGFYSPPLPRAQM